MYKNIKNIDKIVYGPGSFGQLNDILDPERSTNNGNMIFLVDDFFEGHAVAGQLPARGDDVVRFIDASHDEPTTGDVDAMRDEILADQGLPAGVVGVGGGSVMDLAKALALMLTNGGSSERYQGLDLIQRPGVYHCGVPTISGTGAECSTTAVLTGPIKKLGLKCEWTPFDQIVLDPALTATVPTDQWFYTGMDCYIHCIESASGRHYNAFSKAYGDQAIGLCREVFLGSESGQSPANDEKLMVASLFGGLSLTYSEVGVCHAISYGLSKVLGMRHGIANCTAFNQLEEYYPKGVDDFRAMVAHHDISLPRGLAAEWTEEQVTAMAQVAYRLPHMWDHALGTDWEAQITIDDIKALYYRL